MPPLPVLATLPIHLCAARHVRRVPKASASRVGSKSSRYSCAAAELQRPASPLASVRRVSRSSGWERVRLHVHVWQRLKISREGRAHRTPAQPWFLVHMLCCVSAFALAVPKPEGVSVSELQPQMHLLAAARPIIDQSHPSWSIRSEGHQSGDGQPHLRHLLQQQMHNVLQDDSECIAKGNEKLRSSAFAPPPPPGWKKGTVEPY